MTANTDTGPFATREVTITRVYDAPRTLVFKMWIEPEHLAQWWGPKGFTNPVCHVDARPGGAIRIDMRGPDGAVYPMTGTFHEIAEPERIVFTAVAIDREGSAHAEALTTVTFAEHGGKTKLTVHARGVALTADGAQMLKGMEAGWTQSLERLQALLQ
jgi:uncharacterized protein YndB with AHSA1/START domain